MFGSVEEVFRLGAFKHFALIHENDPVGNFSCKPHFMGHAHHGHAVACQPLHGLKHLTHHLGVKRRCRLIKQHHRRVHRQGACNGYALLLPS